MTSPRLSGARLLGGALVFACAAAATLPASAQSNVDANIDDREKSWKEIAIQIPAAPAEADLLPFAVGPTATQRYAIDAKSVSVGSDGVVRYTVVTTSPAGARNVSYEGIRCKSRERKTYAFGHADGSWGRSRRDEWLPMIGSDRPAPHQAALAEDYFCKDDMVAGKAEEIVQRLRTQKRLWKGSLHD